MGVMHTIFHGYMTLAGPMSAAHTGSLVAWEAGRTTTTYGLKNAEERGMLFIGPGVEVYEGMVVGENAAARRYARINVCKKKHLTNMRSSNKDIEIRLTPPRRCQPGRGRSNTWLKMNCSKSRPLNYRIRKRILNTEERGKTVKKAKEALLEEE